MCLIIMASSVSNVETSQLSRSFFKPHHEKNEEPACVFWSMSRITAELPLVGKDCPCVFWYMSRINQELRLLGKDCPLRRQCQAPKLFLLVKRSQVFRPPNSIKYSKCVTAHKFLIWLLVLNRCPTHDRYILIVLE